MSDTQQGGDSGQQATEGHQTEQNNDQTAADSGGEAQKFAPEIQAILDKANKEAAAARRRAQAAESKVSQFEQANLSEVEKLQAQLKEAEEKVTTTEARARNTALKAEVTSAAAALGFRNPNVAHKLLDQDQVEYDDEGSPTNVEALLKAQLKSDPYLASTGSADGGQGREQTSALNMNDALRRAAGRKT